MIENILAERQKTHGDFYDVAMTAQTLKDAMRRGKNWKILDDTQRETLEMIASKIGRILAGNPHEPDHFQDIAGYAQLIVNAYNAVERDPIRPHDECSPSTPAPAREASVLGGWATLPGTSR
jgi:hypothetical protein